MWPHAHLPIFISVTSSLFTWELVDWHCLHPVQLSWLNDHLVVVFSYLIERLTSSSSYSIHTVSSCLLLIHVSILCRVLLIYLNSVTRGSWEDYMLTLPNGVPFRCRSMNIHCIYCCPSLHLCCTCLSEEMASVVDFPFTNPNCSSLMLTMFISEFSYSPI